MIDTIGQRIKDILYIYNISGEMVDYSDIPETRRFALLYPYMATPIHMDVRFKVKQKERNQFLKEHFKPTEAAIKQADLLLQQKIDELKESNCS